jgi:hypothetical protein
LGRANCALARALAVLVAIVSREFSLDAQQTLQQPPRKRMLSLNDWLSSASEALAKAAARGSTIPEQ